MKTNFMNCLIGTAQIACQAQLGLSHNKVMVAEAIIKSIYRVNLKKAMIVLIMTLVSIAVFTLAERKVMAAMQRRSGPKKVGIFGQLQPFADGLKLIIKESIIPIEASTILFNLMPLLALIIPLISWAILPLSQGIAISELVGFGLLIIIALSELSIYAVILSGWSSNSKFPLIGSLRSTAQMISYSVSLSILLLMAAMAVSSLNLLDFLDFKIANRLLIFPLFPIALLFALSAIAETNRAPFDLPEAESELVAGFFTEYSAIAFAFFFMGEVAAILAISLLFSTIFFAAGMPLHLIFVYFILWIRACLARLRFDQLLTDFGWKFVLPFAMASLLAISVALYFRLLPFAHQCSIW
jgi:NADH-quinone oxidoreductase subunit H